jgi:phytoene desaturase
MGKTAIVIGSGFGGLGAAALLGKAGYTVTVLEKNEQVGGRASLFEVVQNDQGDWLETPVDDSNKGRSFRYDMGPSWYLMPDVFEAFFKLLGEDVHAHLDLKRLDPSYQVFFKDTDKTVQIHSDLERDLPTVEALEPGAGDALQRYLDKAGYQYDIAKDRFMYKNYDSVLDFLTPEVAIQGSKLSVFKNMDKYVNGYFHSDEMRKIMQYPLVFLGSSPYNTPAIYNIMSHIDFNMGVYYPQGGIYEIVKALQDIGQRNGAEFRVNQAVKHIIVEDGKAVGVILENGEELRADIVVSDADIHHTEMDLLDEPYRTKSETYWQKRTLAPSALLLYLGVKGKLPSLQHHNLLFSQDWRKNFGEIFDHPMWPEDPSLYVSNPSKTDPSTAPPGYENLCVLVPIASGLDYDDAKLAEYTDKVLATMETAMGAKNLRQNIIYKKTFCVKDFADRYNSYQGTALGLAHTLMQTAIFRPNNISKKVKGLYYVGAGTNPGIGMPICLISAELMYKRLIGDRSSGPLRPDQLADN